MLQIWTIESVRVEEDRDGVVKTHTVLVRVGLCLTWIPLEHLLSIYLMQRPGQTRTRGYLMTTPVETPNRLKFE